jgi:hypothetical protein
MSAVLSPTTNAVTVSESSGAKVPGPVERYFSALFEITRTQYAWNRVTLLALLGLLLLWAWRVYSTWATWGDLSIDSGREMYVPAVLAQGKMLYRDVWYLYTPAAPYLNSFLFRWFGLRLEVLYWAGCLAALGCAVLLFVVGKRLSSSLMGWTAGAVVLLQSFHSWHFCFPLPYSFASVYGCLMACLFLWLIVRAATSSRWGWMLAASTTAAVALLLKLEIGAACYLTLALLVAARGFRERSWKRVAIDVAAALPGILLCAVVARWMVSIAGTSFITQENLMSWPTSFFMKTYGKTWLEKSGLAITPAALGQSLLRTLFFVGVIMQTYWLAVWRRFDWRSICLGVALFAALLAYFGLALHWSLLSLFGAVVFPMDMVLYIAIAAIGAFYYFLRRPEAQPSLPLILFLTSAALLALRILLRNTPGGYAIYYNGPAVLAFLLLLRPLVPRGGRPPRAVIRVEALLCLACIAVVAIYSGRYTADPTDLVPLVTKHGTIRVPKQIAENYSLAILFMSEHAARGEFALSVPEDTSLYFLAGVPCPTRVFAFTPGVLAPGKMTQEVIGAIERQNVRYLLWSNRTFSDYGAPNFGTDFDQALGAYLTSHYHRVGPLVPHSDIGWQVSFALWERNR